LISSTKISAFIDISGRNFASLDILIKEIYSTDTVLPGILLFRTRRVL
jgi:hypothetical protein